MSDQPPAAIRVLLVDDEPMVRSGLAAIIGTTDDVVVIGEAADGDEAMARIEADSPDVVLLDIRMPGEDGVSVTRRIVNLDNPPAVLILTTWDSDAVTLQAIGAGAAGFLLKTDAGLDILDGIRAVAARSASHRCRPCCRRPPARTRWRGPMPATLSGPCRRASARPSSR